MAALLLITLSPGRAFLLMQHCVLHSQTHTIVQLLRFMLAQQQAGLRPAGPILVAAETHIAVDNIMKKVISVGLTDGLGIDEEQLVEVLLRVGEAGSVSPDLRRWVMMSSHLLGVIWWLVSSRSADPDPKDEQSLASS